MRNYSPNPPAYRRAGERARHASLPASARSANGVLRVFADGPDDSPHRTLQRYFKQIAERYLPSMRVQMVFHRESIRSRRGSKQFRGPGNRGSEVNTPSENYTHEHSATDTFENAAVPYTTRVTKMNAAVLASLALAPSVPITNYAITSGVRKGLRRPMLSRGKTGYDAALRWLRSPESDVAGYAVVIRSTTAPDWERQIWVGDATQYTIPDLSIRRRGDRCESRGSGREPESRLGLPGTFPTGTAVPWPVGDRVSFELSRSSRVADPATDYSATIEP